MDKKRRLLILAKEQYGEFDIKGQSFRYNQWCVNGNFVDTYLWYGNNNATIEVNNNILETTPHESNYPGAYTVMDLTLNHKYLFLIDIKTSSNDILKVVCLNNSQGYNASLKNKDTNNVYTGDTNWHTFYAFSTIASSNSWKTFFVTNAVDTFYFRKVMFVDLTDLGLDSISTISDFYNTDIGKAIQSGFYIPYSQTCAIYNASTPFDFVYRTFTPRNNFQLRGIGNDKDLYDTKSGVITRKVGVVDLGTLSWNYNNGLFWTRISDRKSGNMNINIAKYKVVNTYSNMPDNTITGGYLYYADNIIINDTNYDNTSDFKVAMNGIYLYYQLANATTEQVEGVALNDDTNKCYDKNGLELEIV